MDIHSFSQVRAQILQLLNRPEDAEDLSQEVALACCRMRQLDEPRSPKALILKIARNRRNDMLRRQRYRRTDPLDSDSLDYRTPVADALGCSEIRELVDDLPEVHRDILHEHYFNDRSLAEIADSRGETVDCVKSRHRRALARLRDDPRIKSFHPHDSN